MLWSFSCVLIPCLKNQVVVMCGCGRVYNSVIILARLFLPTHLQDYLLYQSIFLDGMESVSFILVSLGPEQYFISRDRCTFSVDYTKEQCFVNTQVLQVSLFGLPFFFKGIFSSSTKCTQILTHSVLVACYFGTSMSFSILNPKFKAPS